MDDDNHEDKSREFLFDLMIRRGLKDSDEGRVLRQKNYRIL